MPTTTKQIQKFKETACAIGADRSEQRFNTVLKSLANNRRQAKALDSKTLEDLADELGQNEPNKGDEE
jgi:hypothetical protein